MEQKSDPPSTGLENQLRGMILGNVRLPDAQSNQDAHRGRGRGRGGSSRGDRAPHDRAARGQEPQPSSSPFPASSARGGGNDFRGRGYRQRGAPSAPHTQRGPGYMHQGQAPNSGRQYASTHQRQPYHVGPGSPTVQHAPGANPPRIMQRPYHATQVPHHQQQQQQQQPRENPIMQAEYLDGLAEEEIKKVEMSRPEFEEKEAFRQQLEDLFQKRFEEGYSGDIATISLVGFGSLASGFGMPGSDMDLAVVPEWKDSSRADQIGIDRTIPRLLEQAVLDAKMGGRLLTRTRVPILKVCQSPSEALYTALSEERKKWNKLPEEEQYPTDAPPEPSPLPNSLIDVGEEKATDNVNPANSPAFMDNFPELGAAPQSKKQKAAPKAPIKVEPINTETPKIDSPALPVDSVPKLDSVPNASGKQQQQPRGGKVWAREKVIGPLDFPKQGVGIQCDINFENPLGIHNTHMLRCYSMTDPRVRLIVLFVKSWAKRRKINSSYSGTLNSYGWVLMVLHYLVNVAQPPVCPNLQHSIPQPKDVNQLQNFFKDPTVAGYTVRFWRNEEEIVQAAQAGRLTNNRQSVGSLLRGFFQYYASLSAYGSYGPRPPQFYWTNEVISLRTLGGIRSKQDKGWVSAKTTVTAEKKVTNRYLFAIEDPFELDHNVARTVTHRGIVAIRDEFRRAWRILGAIGKGMQPDGGIFDEVVEDLPSPAPKEEAKKAGVEDVGV